MRATTNIYLNKRHQNKNGECPVSIKITFQRERKYYPLNVHLTPDDYKKPKKKHEAEFDFIKSKQAKATTICNDLSDRFTFAAFEREFFAMATGKSETLKDMFDNYISAMDEDRIGNKQACESAKVSLLKFRSNAKLTDITPAWLRSYERWMDEQERSKTTTGMYLRALRAIMKKAIKDKAFPADSYPFGKDAGYEIPTSKNTKKALSLVEIKKIFTYKPEKGSTAERCKDYWVFLYLCNGMNVADFCRLKKTDLKNDTIEFVREKTKRTKREVKRIKIILLPEAQRIISKHSAGGKTSYLFPHITENMDYQAQDKTIANLTRLINDHMKDIAAALEIGQNVTTYFARHSFATILKNSGASVAMISEMLGHSSILTTQNYLDSFEDDQIKKKIKALTAF